MLKLKADPTFTAPVVLSLPGGGTHTIKVVYKHMTRDAYNAFIAAEQKENRSDEDAIMDIASGWFEVEGEFTRENIREFCQQYHLAARAIVSTFVEQLTQYKAKN